MVFDWFFIAWILLICAAVILFIKCLIFPTTLDFIILIIIAFNCFVWGAGRFFYNYDHHDNCHHK